MKIETRQMSNGCELTVRSISDGHGGVPIYMWGGLFGTYLVWSRISRELRQRHPLYIIDYPRYTNASSLFTGRQLNIPMLATFQQELMDAYGHRNVILMGWSYGAQVIAECERLSGVAAMVAISGVAGKPFSHISDPIFETIGIRPRLSETVDWLTRKEETISRLRKMIRRNEHPSRWARRLGLMAPTVDELTMDAVIRDFVNIPAHHYNYYLHIASEHNAIEKVQKTTLPILGISGKLDKLVPARRTREFTKTNSNASDFLLVNGGTHFVPLEYPELLSLKIEEFLKRNQLR
ncbi:MAG: alpha/beta hydrolase [Deltaproteobacteria bacterium]|nr:alpha/beta hydrolase [Deltaproteobacteria bacterium]